VTRFGRHNDQLFYPINARIALTRQSLP
jgi:hypothetical protein